MVQCSIWHSTEKFERNSSLLLWTCSVGNFLTPAQNMKMLIGEVGSHKLDVCRLPLAGVPWSVLVAPSVHIPDNVSWKPSRDGDGVNAGLEVGNPLPFANPAIARVAGGNHPVKVGARKEEYKKYRSVKIDQLRKAIDYASSDGLKSKQKTRIWPY